jgi:hypothetical protein
MASIIEDENREGEVMGCDCFRRGRGGGGKATQRCQRRMTQQRAARWPGRSKVAVGVWRSKMTKKILVGSLNAWLDQTDD